MSESQYTINRIIARNDLQELIAWWDKNGLGSPMNRKSYEWCVTNHMNLMETDAYLAKSHTDKMFWSNRSRILDSILSHPFYRPLDSNIPNVNQQLEEVV